MRIVYVFALICLSLWLKGQTVTVLDKDSEMPIQWVTFLSEHPRISVTTNSKGIADVSMFKGISIIEIKHTGYRPLIYSYGDLKKMDFKIYMEYSPVDLEVFVVSATRWRQGTEDIPIKVSSIQPSEVQLQNPQTAADLLGISGKVFIQKSQQGGGSPMIRGFASNRLLYSVDGIRMNTAIFRGGNIQNVISLDPFAMESTEILFGAGSVMYGSDAIGGVMSFQTLTPQFSVSDEMSISGNVATRHSTANTEFTGHIDINLGWEKWAMLTSFSRFNYGDLRQGSKGPDDYIKPYVVSWENGMDQIYYQQDSLMQIPTAYNQNNLMQKFRYSPNKYWDIQYALHYSSTSDYGRYDRHNRVKNGLPRYGEWNYGPQKWLMNAITIEHTREQKWYNQFTIRLAQQSFEESRISRNFNEADRSIQTEEVEAYSINVDFLKSINEEHTLFYGAEYVLNSVRSTGKVEDILTNTEQIGPSRYPQSLWSSYGFYFNDQYKPSRKFLIQAGIRFSGYALEADFDTTFYPFNFTQASLSNQALTASLGAIWHPMDKLTLSLNMGTAFRSPNVDDMGKVFDSEPGAVLVPNPDLKAEYAYNIDVGLAKVFWDYIKVDGRAYYTFLNHALVRRDFVLNGNDSILFMNEMSKVQAIQNAAFAQVYGWQMGFEIKLPYHLTFNSDINFQKGEEEMDDGSLSPSRHAAPFFGVSRLSYKKDKWHVELYSAYQAERSHENLSVDERDKTEIYALDNQGNTYSPGWYTLNLKANWKLTDYLLISFGVENITDQRYRPYSSGVSAAGRNLMLALRASF
jgi:hemoglobin/transferrin/lactoferrin receptor protein